ncbi:MAG: hypothetical protein HY841_08220 [Bacteroidetes bacterium]|nr:hypothetical protein [Bacteroidota bacterium]
MGYLETSVVVYLRAIYYPNGFNFPMANMSSAIAITELGREAATIIMLAGIGIVAGKNSTQRFAWFLYCFAIWDIFYYVFLKLLLNWPESLFTWDILFLIPLPWVSPVICPCIVSLSMIFLAISLIYFNNKSSSIRINSKEWVLFICGSFVVIVSFIIDCFTFMKSYEGPMLKAVSLYVPVRFDWWIFWLGEIFILTAIAQFYVRAKRLILASEFP